MYIRQNLLGAPRAKIRAIRRKRPSKGKDKPRPAIEK
jgi:hypothetical protein